MSDAEYPEASSDDELTIPTEEKIRAAQEEAARQQEAAVRSKQRLEILIKCKDLDDSYNKEKALFDIEKTRIARELKDRLETKEAARRKLEDAEEAAKSAKRSYTLAESECDRKEDEGKKLSDIYQAAEQDYRSARKAIRISSRPRDTSTSTGKPQAQSVDTDQSLNRQPDGGTSPRLGIAEQSNKTNIPGSKQQSPLASSATAKSSTDERQPASDPFDYGADPFQSDDELLAERRQRTSPEPKSRDVPLQPTGESNNPLPKSPHVSQAEIDFDEVFQGGNRYYIVEFPKDTGAWYILRCDTCKMIFRKEPLSGVRHHLKAKAHGPAIRKDNYAAVSTCGIRVLRCDAEKAAKNNKLFKDATMPDTGNKHTGAAKANAAGRKRRALRPSTANQDKPEDERYDIDELDDEDDPVPQPDGTSGDQSQVFKGIVDPVAGQVYKAYHAREGSWYAVVVLDIYDLTILSISGGSILSTRLVNDEEVEIPECYQVDGDLRQICGFKDGFEHDGAFRQQRSFPCIFLHSRLSIPVDGVLDLTTIIQADVLSWVDAKDLTEYRIGDKNISDHKCATLWNRRMAAFKRRRMESPIDLTSSSDSEGESSLPSPSRIGAGESEISTLPGPEATDTSRSTVPPPITETAASSLDTSTTASPSAVNAEPRTIHTANKMRVSSLKPVETTATSANSSAEAQRGARKAKRTPTGRRWQPPTTLGEKRQGKELPTSSPKKRKMPRPEVVSPQKLESLSAEQLRLISESRSRHGEPESPPKKPKSPVRQDETQHSNGRLPEIDKQQSKPGNDTASPGNRRFPLSPARSVASSAQTSPTRQQAAPAAQASTTKGQAATTSPQKPRAQDAGIMNTKAARPPVQPQANRYSPNKSLENSRDRQKAPGSVQIPATQSPPHDALPSRPPPPLEDGQGSLRQLARDLGVPLPRGNADTVPPPPPTPVQMARTTQPPAPMEIDSPSSFDT